MNLEDIILGDVDCIIFGDVDCIHVMK